MKDLSTKSQQHRDAPMNMRAVSNGVLSQYCNGVLSEPAWSVRETRVGVLLIDALVCLAYSLAAFLGWQRVNVAPRGGGEERKYERISRHASACGWARVRVPRPHELRDTVIRRI